MIKCNIKKIAAFLLMLAIATCFAFMPVQVQAAQKAYMKSVNVKWDFKKNKTISFKTKYAGLGMMKRDVKMTNYKIKNSKINGYKELTFTLKFSYIPKMSGTQVHKCVNSREFSKYNSIGGDFCYAIVDYNTGKSLTANKNMDVYVQSSTWVYSPKKYYYDSHGCWIGTCSYSKTIKVTYPKNYKGLCIGVCGNTVLKDTKKDDTFWDGKTAFGKTTYYDKKDKSVAHFMRVTK